MEEPKKKYECKDCKSIIIVSMITPEEKIRCVCGSTKLELLSKEYNHEEIDNARILMGEAYELIQEVINEYIEVPKQTTKMLAIWLIGTYFHKYFPTYPILFINAMRSSAKTRTLKLISSVAYGGDGFVMNNISDASLFRHPKNFILCIDEIESLGSKDKQTLRELLNSCYKRGTRVPRIKKVRQSNEEKYVTEYYELYFPIALANIWGIEEILESRAITIILEKSDNPLFIKKIEDFENNEKIVKIKQNLAKSVSFMSCRYLQKHIYKDWNNWVNLRYNNINNINIYNNINNINNTEGLIEPISVLEEEVFLKIDRSGINGRMLELYFPLFIIAQDLNEFDEFVEIAKSKAMEKLEEEYAESKDISLFEFIAKHGKEEYIALKDMTSHFKLFVGDTGRDEENWVNEKWMGRALKRLNLIKTKRREASGRFIIVNTEKAKQKLGMFGSNKNETKT